MLFDTHAHYDDEQFDADRDALLASMPGCGISLIVNAASNLQSSRLGLELAEKYRLSTPPSACTPMTRRPWITVRFSSLNSCSDTQRRWPWAKSGLTITTTTRRGMCRK